MLPVLFDLHSAKQMCSGVIEGIPVALLSCKLIVMLRMSVDSRSQRNTTSDT
jgi:hypothetical protein